MKFAMAQRVGTAKPKPKKFLVCLSYYDGDRDEAEDLISLICDLERVRNRDTDFLLVRRADARDLRAGTMAKLEAKFDRVLTHTCRRTDARGWPWAPGSMFFDTLALIASEEPYMSDHFAFIPLEPDCTPLRPGWIGELADEWKKADSDGLAAVGCIHENPSLHLNGVAVYAANLGRRPAARALRGGNAQIAWDIAHAPTMLPMARHSHLFAFQFRRPTITPAELFASGAALYHGVKDSSARNAVRARFVTFSEAKEAPRPPVFTYSNKSDWVDSGETKAVMNLWREGWASRGWNPRILTHADALRSPRYGTLLAAVTRLPYIGDHEESLNQWLRWLALDSTSASEAGLYVDMDVLPGAFVPSDIVDTNVGLVLTDKKDGAIGAAMLSKAALTKFLAAIESYDARAEDVTGARANVTDMTVWAATNPIDIEPTVKLAGSEAASSAKLVRFSATDGKRKSQVMETFLRS